MQKQSPNQTQIAALVGCARSSLLQAAGHSRAACQEHEGCAFLAFEASTAQGVPIEHGDGE